jgi:hypothetical protein
MEDNVKIDLMGAGHEIFDGINLVHGIYQSRALLKTAVDLRVKQAERL